MDIAIKAAKNKKHILVEKPLSNTLNRVSYLKDYSSKQIDI